MGDPFQRLTDSDLWSLASSLRAGRLVPPFAAVGVGRVVAGPLAAELADRMRALADAPGLQALLAEQLRDAKDGLEKLTTDPELAAKYRPQLAELYHQLGDASEMAAGDGGGQPDRAIFDHYDRAVTYRLALVAEAPADVELVVKLSQSLTARGAYRRHLGDPHRAGAIADLRDARDRLAAIPDGHPISPAAVLARARATDRLAETLKDRKESTPRLEPLALVEEAIRSLAAVPSDDDVVAALVDLHTLRGGLLVNAERWDAALVAHAESLRLVSGLRAKYPGRVELVRALGTHYNDSGLALYISGDTARGLELLQRAVSLRKQLVEENPAVSRFQDNLATTYNTLGLIDMTRLGRQEAARELLQQALRLRESLVTRFPTRVDYHHRRGVVLANLTFIESQFGSPDEAFRLVRELARVREDVYAASKTDQHLWFLADAINRRGGLVAARADAWFEWVAAGADLAQARELFLRLPSTRPMHQDGLVQNYIATARWLAGRGHSAEALTELDAARPLAATLATSTPEYRRHFAELLTLRGRLLAASGVREGGRAELVQAIAECKIICEKQPDQWEHAAARRAAEDALREFEATLGPVTPRSKS